MNRENALYIVATPIGNLSDLSHRALEILANVNVIAAEDTRHSAKLLQHYHISTNLIPYHDHGGDNQTQRLLEKLQQGENVALISDAGTPLISDPGYKLVRQARELGIAVVPIPGACALVAALSAAGMPSDRFAFEGFAPAKSAARRGCFERIAQDERTIIFYESPHRIVESLSDMVAILGEERQAVIARELTKNFETFLVGTLAELLTKVTDDADQRKGEIVVLLHGYVTDNRDDVVAPEVQRTLKLLLGELPLKKAAALTAQITGEKKNKLYQWALANDVRN